MTQWVKPHFAMLTWQHVSESDLSCFPSSFLLVFLEGSRWWLNHLHSVIQVGDLGGVLGPWLLPGPEPVVLVTWRVNHCGISLSVSAVSVALSNKWVNKKNSILYLFIVGIQRCLQMHLEYSNLNDCYLQYYWYNI